MRDRLSPLLLLTAALLGASCSPYKAFDSVGYTRAQIAQSAGADVAAAVEIPFAIDDEMRASLGKFTRLSSKEDQRVAQLLDFVFHRLSLTYELLPTRDAIETFRTRKGNCLSFVNLFVGLARDYHLNPFYVEVTDYQHWNHRQGMVISQGHIVAGMYLDSTLKTFDFIPYQEKSYRHFKPVSDLTAIAHFYNNLGAEALMAGNLSEARRLVTLASRVAPRFPNALNNLGVCMARAGDTTGALGEYQQALTIDPGNSMVMTNLLRIYQQQGRTREAAELETKLEETNTGNPFFFVYLGEVALAGGNTAKALEHMVHALRLDSELPEVHLGLVKIYMAQGDLDSARHFLARARKLDATDKEVQKYARLLGQP
jgi:Flp pilus assembly protein TadD